MLDFENQVYENSVIPGSDEYILININMQVEGAVKSIPQSTSSHWNLLLNFELCQTEVK